MSIKNLFRKVLLSRNFSLFLQLVRLRRRRRRRRRHLRLLPNNRRSQTRTGLAKKFSVHFLIKQFDEWSLRRENLKVTFYLISPLNLGPC